ncbi:MAG: cell division protein ZapA [Clostridiales bacterium]|nr:cell division protein ZapA [Clostridiales bacterium]
MEGDVFLMDGKNKVEISISGYNYTLVGKEPVEYLHELAEYVDNRINRIMCSNNNLGLKDAGVLTAFNIADELFKVRQEYEDGNKIAALKKEIDELKCDNAKLKNELSEDKSVNNYKEELKLAYENISNLLIERDKMLEELAKEKEKSNNLHFSLIELKSALVDDKSRLQ